MFAPSSMRPDTVEEELHRYFKAGGNALHLHGEGGETLSREAVGKWLKHLDLREDFFLCAQICHDEWDEKAQLPIDRFSPKAVSEDIDTNLRLLGIESLDMVYLDDRPGRRFEPVFEAMCEEVSTVRIRSIGVRNFSAERLRAAHSFSRNIGSKGVSGLITTELSLLRSSNPLWEGYLPFDDSLKQAVQDLGLTVFAHADDMNLGQCLFGDEDAMARLRPEWIARWEPQSNSELISSIEAEAVAQGKSARDVQLDWLLSQPYPVIAIVSNPDRLD